MGRTFNIIICTVLLGGTVSLAAQAEPRFTVTGNTALAAPQISLDNAIDMVVRNNLSVKMAQYEALKADSDYQKYQQKFTPVFGAEIGESRKELPETDLTEILGTRQYDSYGAIYGGMMLQTGTTIKAGYKTSYHEANEQDAILPLPAMLGGPVALYTAEEPYHQPVLFLQVQQELLKNTFGYTDRRQNDMLKNASQMRYNYITYQLSGLVVLGIIDYWNVAVKRSVLDNAQLELTTNKELLDIMRNNVQFGLVDNFYLNQFNGLVAASEAKVAAGEQYYKESKRTLLRTLNSSANIDTLEIAALREDLPQIDINKSIDIALSKRADYLNTKLAIETMKMQLDVNKNSELPSLIASATWSELGRNNDFAKAYADACLNKYSGWEGKLTFSMPLENKIEDTNERDTTMKIRQAELELTRLEKEIRDEVTNKVERVQTLYTVLQKVRTARQESETYYQRLLGRIRQGSINSAIIKNAVDAMVQTRQQELETLVQYNAALLQLELATNEFFANHDVPIDTYIKEAAK